MGIFLLNLKGIFRFVRKDFVSGELNLLLVSLVISVAAVSTITLFSDRLQQALLIESSSLLAADLAISSDEPINDREALPQGFSVPGLMTSRTASFLTMMFFGEQAQLVSVKAVDEAYPLRGVLLSGNEPFGDAEKARSVPRPGEIWPDQELRLTGLGCDQYYDAPTLLRGRAVALDGLKALGPSTHPIATVKIK